MTNVAERRSQRREARRHTPVVQPGALINKLAPTEVVSAEGVELIHAASMRMLREHGILIVDYPAAAETFRKAGASVEWVDAEHLYPNGDTTKVCGHLVKMEEELLLEHLRNAPAEFTQLARNPARNMAIGGQRTVFAPVYGPPFVADYEHGRRAATLADFQNFAKLAYMAPQIHHNGGTLVEPNDVEVKERHLDMLLAHALYSDKCFMGSVTHRENARDTVLFSEILFGADNIRAHPATLSLINASSPLRFDDRMFGALEIYAQARQAILVTPFLIAGAMSPSTMAATLAQQNAEALFGICYAQMLSPGVPVIYGSFLANIDMRSGAPCFGTPEDALALYAGAQMARRYKLPYRSGGNFTGSRIPDAQAGYESASTMWPTIQAGVNFVLHAAGWLEGGLIAGYEKFIIDLEMCGIMARYMNGIGLEEEDFAWDAYRDVPPGGHFLGAAHTMRHYDTAFYQHGVFSMDNYEKWEAEGSVDTYKRAHGIWKRMLQEYQAPPIDPAARDALHDFVARRRADIRAGKLNRPD